MSEFQLLLTVTRRSQPRFLQVERRIATLLQLLAGDTRDSTAASIHAS